MAQATKGSFKQNEEDFRYYYDAASGRCNPFTYSGCGGNANNFQSLASCQATCGTVGMTSKSYSIIELQSKIVFKLYFVLKY